MSTEEKIENHPIKKVSSKIFDNEIINKENIKVDIEENNKKNISKNKKEKNNKNKKKKVKFNKKIDIINVESLKKYNAENTAEPNPNKDTTKCTCDIF